ncbi:MAG TPA: hypothetical protein DD714_04120 [Candidatus Omnitrophica bacterium]|nr:hypothetical protein [Candidatus Omnitrophota bacterium]
MKRVAFVALSAWLVVLFLIAVGLDATQEWTVYQRRFVKSLNRDERRGLPGGIQQIQVKPLGRVDRCTTCHVAIDKPQLALAEQPFTAHPGDYLTWHPPEQFGCTVCHGGQGLATQVRPAHGEITHWEQPLLRGPLIQASCLKCHGNLEEINAHVPLLRQGIQLYDRLGCAGCHTVHGFGQTVSIDLSDMGDKPWQLLDFTFVEGDHTLAQWIDEHFREPRRVTPGYRMTELPPGEEEIYPTFMPNFGLTDDQARALTVYMLSLTAESLPAKYTIPQTPRVQPAGYATAVERGRAVFQKYGCAGCHGEGGLGGRKNWNAQLGEEEPSLVYVKMTYDRDSLKSLIRDGRQPVPRRDPARPRAPSYMPAWKDRLSETELDDLVEYLLSLYESQVPQPAPVSEPAEAAPTEG